MANRRDAFSEGSGSGAPVGRYQVGEAANDWRYEKREDGAWKRRYGNKSWHAPGSKEHSNMEIAAEAKTIIPHVKKPKKAKGGEPGLTSL